jgi:hypothetical protein
MSAVALSWKPNRSGSAGSRDARLGLVAPAAIRSHDPGGAAAFERAL